MQQKWWERELVNTGFPPISTNSIDCFTAQNFLKKSKNKNKNENKPSRGRRKRRPGEGHYNFFPCLWFLFLCNWPVFKSLYKQIPYSSGLWGTESTNLLFQTSLLQTSWKDGHLSSKVIIIIIIKVYSTTSKSFWSHSLSFACLHFLAFQPRTQLYVSHLNELFRVSLLFRTLQKLAPFQVNHITTLTIFPSRT